MKTKQKNILGVLLLLCFAGLALGVMTKASWLHHFDNSASVLFTKSINPVNTFIFKIVAFFGSPATVIGLTILGCCWLWFKKDLVISLWVGGLQFVGSASAEIIKQLVGRSRPLHQLVLDSGYSFPSGHTFCTTVLVITLLILCLPKIKDQENQLIAIVIGVVWIGMVAASRVYLRDHYASDVIASLLLAGGYLLIITPYAEAVQSKLRSILPERILKPWTPKN